MTAKLKRKARATNRNQRRAQANAEKRGGEVVTLVTLPKDRDKTGLEWLFSKKRITQRQANAGRSYGADYRISTIDGTVPLRSCLNDTPGGSSAASALPAVVYQHEARERLLSARQALSFQADLIAACDLICARQLTPWQAIEISGGGAKDVARLEAVIVVALDLLDKHYRNAR
jgi:hypothetical protein